MKLNTVKVQVQKPVFTATLERSIAILILPHAELASNIEQELQNNPLLEADLEAAPLDDTQSSSLDLEKVNALINLSPPNNAASVSDDEAEFDPSPITNLMTLEDHLFQQLFWEISDPLKREIGNFIIGNLDKDGYLHLTCDDIARMLNISDTAIIAEVLSTVQHFDPLGIATHGLKECLIVQLKARHSTLQGLAIQVVEGFLDLLGEKRYAVLAKKLDVSIDDIIEAGSLIASLEPKPARNYRPHDPNVYVEPDLYLRKNDEGEYVIETNKNGLPILKISQTYRKLLNQPNLKDKDRDFIKEKITNAMNFIRSINQRGETLTAIANFILERQKEFFEGEDSTLAPLILKDVAEHLERCESTISRAISNKYIDTPRGLFALKYFFTNNISQQHHGNVSAHNVKQELAELIENESKASPLSDQDIQDHFKDKGMPLARRTVTKYRQALNIPASHLRK